MINRITALLLYVCVVLCSPTNPNYSLPLDFPQIAVSINNNPDSGYIFLSTYTNEQPIINNYLMILDNLGEPIFFRKTNGYAHDFKVQPSGHLSYIEALSPNSQKTAYIMNNHYAIIDSFTSENYWMDNHEFQLLLNGNALLGARAYRTVDLSQIIEGGSPVAQVEDYIIQEIDQNKNIVFEWNSADYFELTDAPHIDLTSQHIYYVHANAIEIDTDGNILLSSRHMDEITKIDRQTGDIIWRLGGVNNEFTFLNDSLDFQHSIPTPFCYQHDIRRLTNGNITIYDNGNYKHPKYSRMVEYQLDELNMTATLTWEYRDSLFNYSPWMGNVQRLQNENIIGAWNMTDFPTTIIEVGQDCTKTFELSIEEYFDDNNNKRGVWIYRAFRFDWEGTADKPYLWENTYDNSFELNFVQFGENNVIQYYIYHGLSQDMMSKIDSTTNNSYQISNINLGVTNFFQVSSHNFPDIESSLSNVISCTCLSPVQEIYMYTDSLDFGEVAIGDSTILDMPIFNLGNTQLEIDDIILDAPFYININDGSLGAGENLDVQVRFVPVAMGEYSGIVTIYSNDNDEEEVTVQLTGIAVELSVDGHQIPDKFTLHQNHPNPFNPVTTLRYDLLEDTMVNITIYDMMGRVVRTMVNTQQNIGFKSVRWNATNDVGSSVSAGLYLYMIQAGDFRQTKKMVLLK